MGTFPNQGPQGTNNAGTDPAVVPLTPATVSVGTTATSIITIPANGEPILIVNSSSQIVYLGNAGVTTTTGYALATSASVLVTYGPPSPDYGGIACALYGITSTGTSNVTAYTPTTWPVAP